MDLHSPLRLVPFFVFVLVASALTACGGGGSGGGETLPGGGAPPAPGPQFVHVATAANIDANLTWISHPDLDGEPDAVFFITRGPNPSGGTEYLNPDFPGVWYDDSVGRWAIANQGFTAMPEGTAFNIDVATGRPGVFIHTVDATNRFGDHSWIDVPGVTSNANARLILTPRLNTPGRVGAFLNAHPTGLYFESGLGVWYVENQDGVNLPLSTSFNVAIVTSDPLTSVHTTTAASRSLNSTQIDNPAINGDPTALLIVTQVANPDGRSAVVSSPHPVGVHYDSATGRWAIFNEDGTNVPLDAAWYVRVIR